MIDFYILGAYSVTFALLALEVIFLIRRTRKSETTARDRQAAISGPAS